MSGYEPVYGADDATESGQDLIISFIVKAVPWVGLFLLVLLAGWFKAKIKGVHK